MKNTTDILINNELQQGWWKIDKIITDYKRRTWKNLAGLTRCTSRNVAPLTGAKKFNFDIIKWMFEKVIYVIKLLQDVRQLAIKHFWNPSGLDLGRNLKTVAQSWRDCSSSISFKCKMCPFSVKEFRCSLFYRLFCKM